MGLRLKHCHRLQTLPLSFFVAISFFFVGKYHLEMERARPRRADHHSAIFDIHSTNRQHPHRQALSRDLSLVFLFFSWIGLVPKEKVQPPQGHRLWLDVVVFCDHLLHLSLQGMPLPILEVQPFDKPHIKVFPQFSK